MIDTGALGCQWANGGTDCGYNVQTISADGLTVYSEWAHLYYVTMGNLAHAAGPLDTMLVNTGDFLNFEVAALWTGVADAKFPAYAWVFQFYDGIDREGGWHLVMPLNRRGDVGCGNGVDQGGRNELARSADDPVRGKGFFQQAPGR